VRQVFVRLLRSGGAGALAAGTDLATLTVLCELCGVSPRAASVPALTLGTIAMFFAQKYLAFQSRATPSGRELVLFALVQAGGYGLTLVGYDAALQFVPWLAGHYVIARMIVTNLVWLAYSFPLWHCVFRPHAVDKPLIRP
jgi:putative flippase GtrA